VHMGAKNQATMIARPEPDLHAVDPEIDALIRQEDIRQRDSLRLIASENYVSRAVMSATGTSLTNKYAEGYPGKRYYEGMDFVDPIESLAIARARELFAAEHANVQPYSGSPANLAALLALCSPATPSSASPCPRAAT
jgi:glycine hydroxymethyltransferase